MSTDDIDGGIHSSNIAGRDIHIHNNMDGNIPNLVTLGDDEIEDLLSKARQLEIMGNLGGALDIYHQIQNIDPIYPGLK